MNLMKFSSFSRFAAAAFHKTRVKNRLVPVNKFKENNFKKPNLKFNAGAGAAGGALLSFDLFAFFSKKDDEGETPEDKLITTIKRSILCMQREEYVKAEQMLHLALRMAQDIQSKDGVTYVYDLMANLAMDRNQFEKAEKLFVDVMKRLMADGIKEDDIKLLHISSKVAHIAHQSGKLEKAIQGFTWTLEKIDAKLQQAPDDKELRELWGLTKNWLGQTLMESRNYVEAKKNLLDAFAIFTEFNGKLNSEAVTMLNNLSVVCTYLNDITSARKYLDEALEIAKDLPDAAETGMLKANLGLLYLKQGLLQQAKDACGFAWRFGKKVNNSEIVDHADHCLKLINEFNK